MALDDPMSTIRRTPILDSFGSFIPISAADRSGAQAWDADPHTRRHLEVMAAYCRDVLTRADPSSGRAGPVCPYSRRSVARDLMLLTHCRLGRSDEAAIGRALIGLRAAYLDRNATLAEEDRLFHSVVITFPQVAKADAPDLIERLHAQLKPGFTDHGLMFGEFYPTCPAGGLHNPDFRPLQTPVAALVIRHMTLRDAPFLLGTPRFRDNYVRQFGEEGAQYMQAIRDGAPGCKVAPLPPSRSADRARQPS